jgi:hypothetical protein
MPPNERRIAPAREPGEPRHPIALPPDLVDFLKEQELVALFHTSDIGTLLIVKAPAQEIQSLRGTYPIGLEHQLFDHPASPVIRTLLSFHDRPDTPLRLETFTNIADPEQKAHFAGLAEQPHLPILLYDEALRHRLAKRIRNNTAEQIPGLVATAVQLLATIPPERFDFEQAKADVMEVTRL